jgi:antitoxin MazE
LADIINGNQPLINLKNVITFQVFVITNINFVYSMKSMSKGKREKNSTQSVAPLKRANGLFAAIGNNSVRVKVRKIGNSQGIILSNSMISSLGIAGNAEVIITTETGKIVITPVEAKPSINVDLSTWQAQFEAAIKHGDEPEGDLFQRIENQFDKEEW